MGQIRVWGERSYREEVGVRRSADALLLVATPGERSVATGKFFEYLASGRPEFALAEGSEAGRIESDTGVGIVVPEESQHAIGKALHALVLRSGSGEAPPRNRERDELFARSAQMQVLAGHI